MFRFAFAALAALLVAASHVNALPQLANRCDDPQRLVNTVGGSPILAIPSVDVNPEILGDGNSVDVVGHLDPLPDVDGVGSVYHFSATVTQACFINLALNTCDLALFTTNADTVSSVISYYHVDACDSSSGRIREDSEFIARLSEFPDDCGERDPGSQQEFVGIPVESPQTVIVEVVITGIAEIENQSGQSLLVELTGDVTGFGQCFGDPHFNRWGHQIRDTFHGECDLVFVHHENINGKDFSVHTRTTIEDSFSYVDAVAMKYGDDAIEFQHDAIYLNGVKVQDESEVVFGEGNKITNIDDKKRKFVVDIQGKVAVNVASMKKFMSVSVSGSSALAGSTGILGDYETGDMIGRHGQEFDNFEDFAFEWQVNPEDPQIFMDARHPQLPYERCRMPSMSAEARRRKLRGADRKLLEAATEACVKNHIPANVQSCIDDVMFTGELELAEAF